MNPSFAKILLAQLLAMRQDIAHLSTKVSKLVMSIRALNEDLEQHLQTRVAKK